ASRSKAFTNLRHTFIDLHAPLPQAVAVADGDGAVGERLTVDREAEGGADLVLPGVAAAHGALLVVEDVEVRLQVAIDLLGDLGHAVLLHQREDGCLD